MRKITNRVSQRIDLVAFEVWRGVALALVLTAMPVLGCTGPPGVEAAAPGRGLEKVTIALLEHGKPDNTDAAVAGYLFKPAGNGPFPGIIIMHGCDGLEWERPQAASWQLLKGYAQRYVAHGYVALVLDSFAPRPTTPPLPTRVGRRSRRFLIDMSAMPGPVRLLPLRCGRPDVHSGLLIHAKRCGLGFTAILPSRGTRPRLLATTPPATPNPDYCPLLYPDRSRQPYAAARALRRPSGSALMARNKVRAGPLGFLAPRSHSCTVRTLNS